ncbi:meiotic recombination protein SPO11 [Pseudohyphozyma bogoriensis]|nr:meiotic recombination protein SPO11 [Pseudohyphozyma bogoriensis]
MLSDDDDQDDNAILRLDFEDEYQVADDDFLELEAEASEHVALPSQTREVHDDLDNSQGRISLEEQDDWETRSLLLLEESDGDEVIEVATPRDSRQPSQWPSTPSPAPRALPPPRLTPAVSLLSFANPQIPDQEQIDSDHADGDDELLAITPLSSPRARPRSHTPPPIKERVNRVMARIPSGKEKRARGKKARESGTEKGVKRDAEAPAKKRRRKKQVDTPSTAASGHHLVERSSAELSTPSSPTPARLSDTQAHRPLAPPSIDSVDVSNLFPPLIHASQHVALAEMDALFGYVDPDAPPAPPRPEYKTHRLTREQKGKWKDGSGAGEKQLVEQEKRRHYQLQPIPTVSPDTGVPRSREEIRLDVIASFEQLALSIVEQLTEVVLSPSSRNQSRTTSATSNETDLKDFDGAQPEAGPSSMSKVVPRKKAEGIVVILAKRGTSGSTNSAPPDQPGVQQRRIAVPRRNRTGTGSALLKTIEIILEGLKTETISTKRDVFYRDVKLFGKQLKVDSIVEDLAATLRVRREDLGVVAASKGLFAGGVSVVDDEGNVLEGGAKGTLIPSARQIKKLRLDESVKWVLVIEKEAVFQNLCASTFLDSSKHGRGIIITGKGYPDLATREFVKLLSTSLPDTPIMCLVDSDPHGIEILSTYKLGSASLAFDVENLAVERVEWVGVKGTQWDEIGVGREQLLPLTTGDRKKALKMLSRPSIPSEWKKELSYMLHLHCKAEIQILSSSPSPPAFSSTVAAIDSTNVADSPSSAQGPDTQTWSPLFDFVSEKILAVLERAKDRRRVGVDEGGGEDEAQ